LYRAGSGAVRWGAVQAVVEFEREALLKDAFVARIPDFAKQFPEAKPFRHILIDNFLDPSAAERMLGDFPSLSDPSKPVNVFGDPNPRNAVDQVAQITGVQPGGRIT
jgi:hypothetical protein